MSQEEQPPQMPDLMQPAVVLSMAYLSRNYVDDKNPQHVLYVRMLFASSICVMVILNLYIYLLINAKKDKDEDEKEIKVNNPQTGKEEIYKTNKAYDMSEMKKKLTQLIMRQSLQTPLPTSSLYLPGSQATQVVFSLLRLPTGHLTQVLQMHISDWLHSIVSEGILSL